MIQHVNPGNSSIRGIGRRILKKIEGRAGTRETGGHSERLVVLEFSRNR